MSTVIQTVQDVLDDMGIIPPTSITSATDPIDRQMRAILQAEARHLRNKLKIPPQKKLFSFTTTNGRQNYALPEDFYGFCGNTGIDQTNLDYIRGPISDPTFNSQKYIHQPSGSPYGFRIFGPDGNVSSATAGGQFQVMPTPASTITLSFEYFSKNLFTPPYWTASEAIDSTSVYRSSNGNIYKCTVTGTTGSTPPSHTSGTATDGTVTWQYISAPYERIINDSDLNLFDDDLMYEGFKYRYQKSKGLAYDIDPVTGYSLEYKRLIDRAASRWYGGYRGRFDRPRSGPRYYIPYRGHL